MVLIKYTISITFLFFLKTTNSIMKTNFFLKQSGNRYYVIVPYRTGQKTIQKCSLFKGNEAKLEDIQMFPVSRQVSASSHLGIACK